VFISGSPLGRRDRHLGLVTEFVSASPAFRVRDLTRDKLLSDGFGFRRLFDCVMACATSSELIDPSSSLQAGVAHFAPGRSGRSLRLSAHPPQQRAASFEGWRRF